MRSSKIFLSLCLSLVLMASACKRETPVEPEPLQPQVPQWAMFGKNLRNTSNAADPVEYYSGPQQGVVVWAVDFGQFGYSEVLWAAPVIGPDGMIYQSTSPFSARADTIGFVYAINQEGIIRWRFKTDNGNLQNGALGIDGTYFFGSGDKHFYAISTEGKLKWKRNLYVHSGPTITRNGQVIVALDSGIVALDEQTGSTIWNYETQSITQYEISIDSDGNIYSSTWGSVFALSSDGALKWEFLTPSAPREVVIAHDGALLFTLWNDSLLYALSPSGELLWTFNLLGFSSNNMPVIAPDGTIVVLGASTVNSKLHKIDPKGSLLWTIDISQLTGTEYYFLNESIPIIDKNGTIYLGIGRTGGSNLYAIDANGKGKWHAIIEDPKSILSAPAISPDGTLYIAAKQSLIAVK